MTALLRLRRETRRIGVEAAAARRERDHGQASLTVEAETLRAQGLCCVDGG
jgi:hypothetical protein